MWGQINITIVFNTIVFAIIAGFIELIGYFGRKLTAGIDETGIVAGVIGEIGMATSPMDPDEKKVLDAQEEPDSVPEALPVPDKLELLASEVLPHLERNHIFF